MEKIRLFAVITLIFCNSAILKSQDKYFINYSETLATTQELKEIYKYAFMANEFISLIRIDSNLIKNYVFNRENYMRTKGEEYYYDMSINLLKNKLLGAENDTNKNVVETIISYLPTNAHPEKPNVGWEKVFNTCQTCFFGTYPADRFTYFNFSLIFMGETEIKEMINYENGQQWKYALMAIKGGDSFNLEKGSKYGDDILDRRIAAYIIEKWKNCEIPEVQELIKTYKSVM